MMITWILIHITVKYFTTNITSKSSMNPLHLQYLIKETLSNLNNHSIILQARIMNQISVKCSLDYKVLYKVNLLRFRSSLFQLWWTIRNRSKPESDSKLHFKRIQRCNTKVSIYSLAGFNYLMIPFCIFTDYL